MYLKVSHGVTPLISPVMFKPVQVYLHLSCERRRLLELKLCPVIAMGGLVFDFALSSNIDVDGVDNICSGIKNLDHEGAVS